MNIPLLKEIRKEILAEPQRLDMNHWINPDDNTASCGTAACVAGWAVILTMRKEDRRKSWQKIAYEIWKSQAVDWSGASSRWPTEVAGRERLGLSASEADRLFFVEEWPYKFRKPFSALNDYFEDIEDEADLKERLKLRKQMARIAANRISHFIKTHGR